MLMIRFYTSCSVVMLREMDTAKKERVGRKILAVLAEEGVTDPAEVLDLMRDGAVGAVETMAPPIASLDDVPQPYHGMFRSIAPADTYLVVTCTVEGSLPVPDRIVRVPAKTPEEKVVLAAKALAGPGRTVHRVTGVYLKAWIITFAHSLGHLTTMKVDPPKPAAYASMVTLG